MQGCHCAVEPGHIAARVLAQLGERGCVIRELVGLLDSPHQESRAESVDLEG
jgi:hypothetical protein